MPLQFIIFDLEATCWENIRYASNAEIIEIGALRMTSPDGPPQDEFCAFIQPVAQRMLSEFCKNLTTITQEDVDAAEQFWAVLPKFVEWIGPDPFVLCSWGNYDLNQFQQDCDRHALPLPEGFTNHINLKQQFARIQNVKICGMAKALEIVQIPQTGTHHRGIDDARNLAKLAALILPQLQMEGAIPGTNALVKLTYLDNGKLHEDIILELAGQRFIEDSYYLALFPSILPDDPSPAKIRIVLRTLLETWLKAAITLPDKATVYLPYGFSDQCTAWVRCIRAGDTVELQAGGSTVEGWTFSSASDIEEKMHHLPDFHPTGKSISAPHAQLVVSIRKLLNSQEH